MENLFEIQRVILEQFHPETIYSRYCFNKLTMDNFATAIMGPRGVGKTTWLLMQALKLGANNRKALYVSADSLFFVENSLIGLADWLYKETNTKYLIIDEIHKYANWVQELKNIIDTYKDLRILFSGSSAIDIIRSKYDLSRRVTVHSLHGLSFREFLEYYLDLKLPRFSLNEIVQDHLDIAQSQNVSQILKYFRDYLRIGYYPFFKLLTQDQEKFQAIENATQKTIYEDIGTLHKIHSNNLIVIEKIFKYIINSSPGELNTYKLSNYLGKDFETVDNYLRYLYEAGLIRFLYANKTGKSLLNKPIKMYAENTNMVYANYLIPQNSDDILGKIRETFIVNCFQNNNHSVFYSEVGDFKCDDYFFEVGGKNKKTKQLKLEKNGYIIADGIITGTGKNIIPIYLFGFLS